MNLFSVYTYDFCISDIELLVLSKQWLDIDVLINVKRGKLNEINCSKINVGLHFDYIKISL